MRTVSWVLLALVAFLVVLGSAGSLTLAYFGSPADDVLAGTSSLENLNLSPDVVQALRGRRGTAASLGMAFGVLMFAVALVPYRRGEVWAWWALLAANGVLAAALILRIPFLGITQGATTSVVFLLAIVALLLDVTRLARRAPAAPPIEPRQTGDPGI